MNTERISIPAAIFRTGRALVLAAVLTVGLTGLLRAEVLTSVLATNLFEPYGLVVSENNRIFVADSANNRIVRYNQASGVVEEFAGRRGADNKGAVDSAGTLARFYGPQGLVMSRDLLIVADTANNLIRTITTNGVVATVAEGVEEPRLRTGDHLHLLRELGRVQFLRVRLDGARDFVVRALAVE